MLSWQYSENYCSVYKLLVWQGKFLKKGKGIICLQLLLRKVIKNFTVHCWTVWQNTRVGIYFCKESRDEAWIIIKTATLSPQWLSKDLFILGFSCIPSHPYQSRVPVTLMRQLRNWNDIHIHHWCIQSNAASV